ncbi:MAG TPA: hypothetical protein DCZ11_10285 [Gammaproteobacteria bacterium]|nr:hypothetical protein [Gammaproteobacteria bacterium]HCZ49382.1 hypothetical protein [Gammaproteobacteria bacterium]MCH78820.1 hypothetical protein [Gammaproteobacteria bacterium]
MLVQPRAARSAVAGVHDGRLKVRLTAPPVDGAANAALLDLLAARLAVPRSRLCLAKGDSARRKTVRIAAGAELAPALQSLLVAT